MQRRLGYAQWRVNERGTARLVGIAGLQPLDGGPEVELTYALVPAAWGRGLATEAGAAALRYAFEEAGLERVVGIVKPENGASLTVLRKLGLRAVGEADHWGRRWEKYELVAADWRAEQAAARPPLRTERLELRRFGSPDLGPLLTAFGDPEVMRYVGAERRPLTGNAVRALMRAADGHWADHGFGLLAVVERASGRVVGEAGLQFLEGGPDVELGYTLSHAAWGRGYATEAARAVLRWAFAGLRLERVRGRGRPRQRGLAARARQARHAAPGHAALLRRADGGVGALAQRVARPGRPFSGRRLTRSRPGGRSRAGRASILAR